MTVELTQEVSSRLSSDHYGWLTTVAKSGQPVPRLIWFYFDGADLTVYSTPRAAKVAHVKAHPEVSLNLDSNGNGGGIIVVGGIGTVDATDVNCQEAERELAAKIWPKNRSEFTLGEDISGSHANASRPLR
jgi:PPOX class probable F420-dependent enzyme